MEVLCGQCGKLLTVDDGFSGGYCRCTQCKAITLVPPSLDQEFDEFNKVDRPDNPGKRKPTVKPASRKPAGDSSGSHAVPSPVRPAAPAGRAKGKDHLGLYLILGAVILSALLLGLAAWLRFR